MSVRRLSSCSMQVQEDSCRELNCLHNFQGRGARTSAQVREVREEPAGAQRTQHFQILERHEINGRKWIWYECLHWIQGSGGRRTACQTVGGRQSDSIDDMIASSWMDMITWSWMPVWDIEARGSSDARVWNDRAWRQWNMVYRVNRDHSEMTGYIPLREAWAPSPLTFMKMQVMTSIQPIVMKCKEMSVKKASQIFIFNVISNLESST